VPGDENTGEPAGVGVPLASIGLAAQAPPIGVSAAPLGSAPAVQIARGQPAAAVLSFTLSRIAEDRSAPAVLLDAVAARVLDAGGAPLDPELVLSTLELRRDGRLLGVWTPGTGAITAGGARVALTTPDTLVGGGERAYVLAMGLATGAPAGRLRLELPSSGAFEARDLESGASVAILLDAPLGSDTLTLYEAPHNYPNPFAPDRERTTISYVLDRDGEVAIDIFTLFGDRVWSQQLAAGANGGRAGLNEVSWDGRNGNGDAIRNGVYLCRVRGAGLEARWKIALAR
jgi:hypothetical protein